MQLPSKRMDQSYGRKKIIAILFVFEASLSSI